MDKIHFWLIGFGVCWLAAVFMFDAPMGLFAIGVPIGAIGLGIRQWFMADAHAERRDGAFFQHRRRRELRQISLPRTRLIPIS